jgi:hypothetical protein
VETTVIHRSWMFPFDPGSGRDGSVPVAPDEVECAQQVVSLRVPSLCPEQVGKRQPAAALDLHTGPCVEYDRHRSGHGLLCSIEPPEVLLDCTDREKGHDERGGSRPVRSPQHRGGFNREAVGVVERPGGSLPRCFLEQALRVDGSPRHRRSPLPAVISSRVPTGRGLA